MINFPACRNLVCQGNIENPSPWWRESHDMSSLWTPLNFMAQNKRHQERARHQIPIPQFDHGCQLCPGFFYPFPNMWSTKIAEEKHPTFWTWQVVLSVCGASSRLKTTKPPPRQRWWNRTQYNCCFVNKFRGWWVTNPPGCGQGESAHLATKIMAISWCFSTPPNPKLGRIWKSSGGGVVYANLGRQHANLSRQRWAVKMGG